MKAILFDMDGVIVDSMPYHFIAWYEALRPAGVRVSCFDVYIKEGENWQETMIDFLRKARIQITGQLLKKIIKARHKAFRKSFKKFIFSEAEDLLKCLKRKGFLLALVTGTLSREVRRMLPEDIYSLFDYIVAGDKVKNGKPHPEPYLKAARGLKVSPKECIVVENAPSGIKSAKSAGMFCIAVTTSLPKEYLKQADIVVDSLKEVPKILNCKKSSE